MRGSCRVVRIWRVHRFPAVASGEFHSGSADSRRLGSYQALGAGAFLRA